MASHYGYEMKAPEGKNEFSTQSATAFVRNQLENVKGAITLTPSTTLPANTAYPGT